MFSVDAINANKMAYDLNNADENWRIIYFFPVFVNLIGLIGYFCIIRVDPIMFSIRKGNDEEALKLIKKVYSTEEDPNEILA